MKICVVTQQIGRVFTGPGLHAANLVNRLVQDGHEVCVVAPHNQRPPGELKYRFVGVARPFLAGSQARWVSLSRLFAGVLAALQKEQRFDLIHFTDARESLFTRSTTALVGSMNDTYAAEIQPLGYYRRYYNDWLTRWLYYYWLHGVEKRSLLRLDAVLANSRYTARAIADQYRVPAGRLHVCYKSVDVAYWQEKAGAFRTQPDPQRPQILFTGTNMQRKGLPSLIRAAPEIVRAFPQVQFVVVGEDKIIPQMKHLCAELSVAHNFTFLGWQSQEKLPGIYARADLFVMPSLTEALGVTFLEALAAGCIPIGSAAGGIPEIIHDGENGLLVPPDAPGRLAEAILRVLQDPQLARRLRENGPPSLAPFRLDEMMKCTYGVYQTVLKADPSQSMKPSIQ